MAVLLFFYFPGAADEATAVFSEAAALCIQKQYLQNAQNLHLSNEDRNLVSSKSSASEDVSPRQLKNIQANNLKDLPGNYHGAVVLAGAASQPLNGGPSNISSFYNTPSPMTTQVLMQITLCCLLLEKFSNI